MKDLNVMEFDESVKQDTPLGLLRGIKFGTETYHTLFMRLCRCARARSTGVVIGTSPAIYPEAAAIVIIARWPLENDLDVS